MLVLVALIITTVKTNEGSADSDVKIKENDNDTTAVIQNFPRLTRLENELRSLKTKINSQCANSRSCKSLKKFQKEIISAEVLRLNERITLLENKSLVPGPVAFTVTTPVANRNRLHFQHTTINHGNGYNVTSGAFEAPQSGTYFFSVTLYMQQTKTAYFDLYKNGSPTFRALRESVVRRQNGGVTLNGHLELNKRDAVWVRVISGLVKPSYMSMFSGHLIN